jgi:hypothetical protein
MKVARTRNTTTFRRPTPLRRKVSQISQQAKPQQENSIPQLKTASFDVLNQAIDTNTNTNPQTRSLSDGLAICLFGLTANMFVSEDEEEVRKRVIMSVSCAERALAFDHG